MSRYRKLGHRLLLTYRTGFPLISTNTPCSIFLLHSTTIVRELTSK
uniref:Uncharacterized protein n=1 Tax=Rhizophora mucronata TaxID=61149 RepID=A0A2P2QMH9_RHIMU